MALFGIAVSAETTDAQRRSQPALLLPRRTQFSRFLCHGYRYACKHLQLYLFRFWHFGKWNTHAPSVQTLARPILWNLYRSTKKSRPIDLPAADSRPIASKIECFGGHFYEWKPVKPTASTGVMERAMGIEIIATWFFKDLRSRARTDLEGLGSLRNPYCRLNAALLP